MTVDPLISRNRLLAQCRGATPGRQWTAEAVDALRALGEAYVGDLIVSIALSDRTVRYGKTGRVTAEDIQRAVANREREYVAWLEEVNDAYARAAKAAGVSLPKTRPAPLPSKRSGVES